MEEEEDGCVELYIDGGTLVLQAWVEESAMDSVGGDRGTGPIGGENGGDSRFWLGVVGREDERFIAERSGGGRGICCGRFGEATADRDILGSSIGQWFVLTVESLETGLGACSEVLSMASIDRVLINWIRTSASVKCVASRLHCI